MTKPAARMGDLHTCPLVNPGPVPHVGGPVSAGLPTVLIGSQPAARVGDPAVCVGPPDAIALGSFTVQIGGQPSARMGDVTAHGGVIVAGLPTVLIGDSAGASGFSVTMQADGTVQFGNKLVVMGTRDFQAKVVTDLARMAQVLSTDPSRAGAGLTTLQNLDAGRHEVKIIEVGGVTGNSCDIQNLGSAQDPAIGSASTVKYNSTREPPTAADPSVNRPADVGLHHELVHADHASSGTVDTNPATNPNNPHVEEEDTIARDNLYRDDRSIPRRADHTVL